MSVKPDKKIIGLMCRIARDARLKNFLLFGGCPIDSIAGLEARTGRNDIDIAIRGLGAARMRDFENSVIDRGYTVLFARRPYKIQHDLAVRSTYVKKGHTVIDANFMENPESVGLFNIDSLYVRFPSYELVDAHGCLDGLKEEKITLIRSVETENAYLLAARFIYLSAKYSISILAPDNACVASNIVRAMKKEGHTPSWQFDSFLSSLLKSTLKSCNGLAYLRELLEVGFLGEGLPELEVAVKLIARSKARSHLKGVSSVNDLIFTFLRHMPAPCKESFRKKLLPLADRVWEKSERRVNMNTIL